MDGVGDGGMGRVMVGEGYKEARGLKCGGMLQ